MDIKKRFDRILSVFIHLQSKPIVTAQELAERFNVSLRTIYRDIRSLEQAGVPLYSESGIGYSIVDGYKIPPTLFTQEEALSFVAAEKIMNVYVDKELGEHFSSALFDKNVFNKKVPSALSTLFKSISTKHQIILEYKNNSENSVSQRIVEPIGVFLENNYWYLIAYCHLRDGYRQFRADRIQSIKLLDIEFTLKHENLEAYLPSKTNDKNVSVRILVEKSIASYLVWDRNYYGFVEEINCGDKVEMRFMMNSLNNGFARWYLMFADKADIIEPDELHSQVLHLLEKSRTRINEKKVPSNK